MTSDSHPSGGDKLGLRNRGACQCKGIFLILILKQCPCYPCLTEGLGFQVSLQATGLLASAIGSCAVCLPAPTGVRACCVERHRA